MKTVSWSLSSLLLFTALTACAPGLVQVQGPGGTQAIKVVSSQSRLFVERVDLANLKDTTPPSAYVNFPGCDEAVVSVEGVRAVGPDAALLACQKANQDFKDARDRTNIITTAIGIAGIPVFYFVAKVFLAIFGASI